MIGAAAALSGSFRVGQDVMFSFGEFFNLERESQRTNFAAWELILFLAMGAMGGLIGAAFNGANLRITQWRKTHVPAGSPLRRALEVQLVCLAMSVVAFGASAAWPSCTPVPSDVDGWTSQEVGLLDELVRFRCAPGEYNELASLFLADSDVAIKQLFHFREVGGREARGEPQHPTFSGPALLCFFLPYIAMAVWTYGIGVPSGLFVPSLLSGAAFGRLCGHALHYFDASRGTFADAGTYALVGAAAVLGGMARMTISLTVILLEATGDMQYALPLMLVLLAAQRVGNLFNEGLYDVHIRLRAWPFLDEHPPALSSTTSGPHRLP